MLCSYFYLLTFLGTKASGQKAISADIVAAHAQYHTLRLNFFEAFEALLDTCIALTICIIKFFLNLVCIHVFFEFMQIEYQTSKIFYQSLQMFGLQGHLLAVEKRCLRWWEERSHLLTPCHSCQFLCCPTKQFGSPSQFFFPLLLVTSPTF